LYWRVNFSATLREEHEQLISESTRFVRASVAKRNKTESGFYSLIDIEDVNNFHCM
jgi:hypothetical protein